MSNQTKNAQPSPSDKEPRNAGGIDDIDEGQDENEYVETEFDERQERVGQDDARRAGGGRGSESEKPNSPDSRWGSERKS